MKGYLISLLLNPSLLDDLALNVYLPGDKLLYLIYGYSKDSSHVELKPSKK